MDGHRECALRRKVQGLGVDCDEDRCLFWAQFGPEDAPPQCAVQYFRLLEGPDSALAEWLLGLKQSEIAGLLGVRRVPHAD